MAEKNKPRIMVKFTTEDISDGVSTITFTDDKSMDTAFYIDPSNLNVLLPELLRFAVRWSKHPDLKADKFSGENQFLAAQRIELDKGRHERELAARIFVGDVQFSFLLPLDSLHDAIGNILPHLKPMQ